MTLHPVNLFKHPVYTHMSRAPPETVETRGNGKNWQVALRPTAYTFPFVSRATPIPWSNSPPLLTKDENSNLVPVEFKLARNAACPVAIWYASAVVGKLFDSDAPVVQILFEPSNAIAIASSSPFPPRQVEKTKAEPVELSFVTNASPQVSSRAAQPEPLAPPKPGQISVMGRLHQLPGPERVAPGVVGTTRSADSELNNGQSVGTEILSRYARSSRNAVMLPFASCTKYSTARFVL